MFGLGFPELLIILIIILVIFGAGKLPQVGEAMGKGIKKFRGAMEETPETHQPSSASLDASSKGEDGDRL